jgi:hypothetical protein
LGLSITRPTLSPQNIPGGFLFWHFLRAMSNRRT